MTRTSAVAASDSSPDRAAADAPVSAAADAPVDAAELNRWITGFDQVYGLEFVSCGEEEVSATVRIDAHHRQPLGLVHGGVYMGMAESMTTIATALCVATQGNTALGLSNNTSFVRAIGEGTIHASGRRRHAGRSTWVWDVEMCDDDGRLCALSRTTIAVRPLPS